MMPEMLDVVDENDNVIGRQSRAAVHGSRMWHRGIHVFMFDRGGNFIVQKRSMKKDKSPGLFDCLSGHVKSGFTYDETAREELEEEIGLTGEPAPMIKLKMKYGGTDWMITKLYRITVDPSQIEIDRDEIENLATLSGSELKSMIRKSPEKFTRWFLELLKWHLGEKSLIDVMEKYQKA
ncbi:MAG: NUDIX domain-containing protein [Candidatus Aenigmatarchaeota archaeon]